MYPENPHLLFIAASAAGILLCSCLFLLVLLRRERALRQRLAVRGEAHASETAALEATCERLRDERTGLYGENRELAARLAALQATLAETEKQSETHRSLLETTRKQMEKDFLLLAEQVFTAKGATLTNTHQERLGSLLGPVREQLGEFKKRIEDIYDRESRDRVALLKEIEHLKELNTQISEDALALTGALRGQSKTQGIWGEMILEQLLEHAGLVRGREFETQVTLQDARGALFRPDVVIRLPGKRDIIVDAKVSLKAFVEAGQADEREKAEQLMRAHLDSIKNHINSLAAKKYHLLEPLHSPDFVLLFLPAEAAFQAAVEREPDILTMAVKKKVIVAGPSTLLAILRLINHLWRRDEQNRNSLAIAKQAGSLYDKLTGFIEAFEEIGTRLRQADEAWELAGKRLSTGRGNVISRAEALARLGVQHSKTMPRPTHAGQDEPETAPVLHD